jgi:hypothetical protein
MKGTHLTRDRHVFTEIIPSEINKVFGKIFKPSAHPDYEGYLTTDPRFTTQHIGTSVNKYDQSMEDFIAKGHGMYMVNTLKKGRALFIASSTYHPCTNSPRPNPDQVTMERYCEENGIIADIETLIVHYIYVGIRLTPKAIYNPVMYAWDKVETNIDKACKLANDALQSKYPWLADQEKTKTIQST